MLAVETFSWGTTELHMADAVGYLFVRVITYAGLGYCYFHFINLGETARRIRILRELYQAENGLSVEEIIKRYNAETIIEKRIARLIGNRQIECRDGKYYIRNGTMVGISRLIRFVKYMMLGRRSEFD